MSKYHACFTLPGTLIHTDDLKTEWISGQIQPHISWPRDKSFKDCCVFFFFLLTSSTTYLSLSSHCCVLLQMWHCLDTFVLGLGQETCTGCDVMLYLKGEAM